MAEQEKKVILTVDTGSSEKTVKSLKKDISDLKDAILNLEKGTEEYDSAVEQLQASQRELNEVQALTKKSAVALEGSYDALTHQMSLLKKEWRATADEARRADLGKQIDEINQQLKEMDASVGNFQRNVGNYVSHWEGMPEVTQDFGTAMREMNDSIEPTKAKFESMTKIASGLASGFAAVQGAAALLGIENENLEKSLVKVQSAMAMAQGIGGIGDLVEGLGKAKVAFKSVGTALGGTAGIVALFVALAAACLAVVGNMDKLERKFKKLSEADQTAVDLAKLNVELTKLSSQASAENITRLKELADGYKQLGNNLAGKEQYVKDFAEELSEMGIEMTNVNDADKIFIEQTDNYINALIARAKADAIKEKATADYRASLEKTAELEADLAEAKANQNNKTPKKTFWQNLGQAALVAGSYEGVPLDQIESTKKGWDEDIAQQNVDKAQAALDEAKANADKALADAFKMAEEYNAEANAYLTPPKKKNTPQTPKPKTPKPKTPEDLLAELSQKLYDDAINMVIEDVEINLKESTKKSNGYEYKNGDAEKRANWWTSLIDTETSQDIRKNVLEGGTEEEQDDLIIKGEQRKLEKLKEFWKQAKEEGDVTGELALRQQIADQELLIEEEKNRAIIESEERAKEKRIKIMNDVSDALSAAANVTEGILQITQAAAEKDGEVTEREAKRIKGIQVAIATMNMLQGITTALSGCFTTKTGPWDIALAAVQAASIAASGTANIMKIKNTDLTGSVSNGAMGAVVPNVSSYSSELPVNYTRNVTTASEVDELNKSTKVYVLESDIADAMTKVSVRESESSF